MKKEKKEIVEEVKVSEPQSPKGKVEGELPKEEKKVETKDTNTNKDSVILEKYDKTIEQFGDSIEEKRKKLFDFFKKNKMINNIIMVVVVLLVMGALGLLILNKDWSKITGYVLGGCVLLGLIIYYFFTKNRFPSATKVYIKDVTKELDEFIFSGEDFKDCSVNTSEKLDLNIINCDKVYKDSVEIGSRNVVKGKYSNMKFACSELAIYHLEKDKRNTQKKVSFLGKYITCDNNLKFAGRYIVVSKSIDDVKEGYQDQPTDIEDLEVISDENNFVIYGPKDSKEKMPLVSKYINSLKHIKPSGSFLNFVAVIWEGHSAYYLSYDDSVITLPFEKPFEPVKQDNLRNDIETVLKANSNISK